MLPIVHFVSLLRLRTDRLQLMVWLRLGTTFEYISVCLDEFGMYLNELGV